MKDLLVALTTQVGISIILEIGSPNIWRQMWFVKSIGMCINLAQYTGGRNGPYRELQHKVVII